MTLLIPLALSALTGCTAPDEKPALSANDDDSSAIRDDAISAEVDALILDKMQRARLPGLAAAIVDERGVIWSRGYGVRDADTGEPVRADTPFMLASVSKTVVATAVMREVDRGGLSLDDRIAELTGEAVENPDHPEPITLRQTLAHTSSILDAPLAWSEYTDGDSDIPLDSFLSSLLVEGGSRYSGKSYGNWAPGRRAEYSNIGNSTAAWALQAAAGTGFDDYCEAEVFAPLGMQDTHWHLADFADPDTLASPHTTRDGERFRVVPHYGFPDYPDGQLRSPVNDLGRLVAMMINDGQPADPAAPPFLSPEAVAEIERAQYPGVDPDQGVAWYYTDTDSGRMLTHEGEDEGVSTILFYSVEQGRGVVILMNSDWYDSDAVYRIQDALYGAGGR